jgi:hypothetical protein
MSGSCEQLWAPWACPTEVLLDSTAGLSDRPMAAAGVCLAAALGPKQQYIIRACCRGVIKPDTYSVALLVLHAGAAEWADEFLELAFKAAGFSVTTYLRNVTTTRTWRAAKREIRASLEALEASDKADEADEADSDGDDSEYNESEDLQVLPLLVRGSLAGPGRVTDAIVAEAARILRPTGPLTGIVEPPMPTAPLNWPGKARLTWPEFVPLVKRHLLLAYSFVPPVTRRARLGGADFKRDAARPMASTNDATDKTFGCAAAALLVNGTGSGNTKVYYDVQPREGHGGREPEPDSPTCWPGAYHRHLKAVLEGMPKER